MKTGKTGVKKVVSNTLVLVIFEMKDCIMNCIVG